MVDVYPYLSFREEIYNWRCWSRLVTGQVRGGLRVMAWRLFSYSGRSDACPSSRQWVRPLSQQLVFKVVDFSSLHSTSSPQGMLRWVQVKSGCWPLESKVQSRNNRGPLFSIDQPDLQYTVYPWHILCPCVTVGLAYAGLGFPYSRVLPAGFPAWVRVSTGSYVLYSIPWSSGADSKGNLILAQSLHSQASKVCF